MKDYKEIKTIPVEANQRLCITYDELEAKDLYFMFTPLYGIHCRLIVIEKIYDNGTKRYEVEMHSSMDKLHWGYNCYFDQIKMIELQNFGEQRKEVWNINDQLREDVCGLGEEKI